MNHQKRFDDRNSRAHHLFFFIVAVILAFLQSIITIFYEHISFILLHCFFVVVVVNCMFLYIFSMFHHFIHVFCVCVKSFLIFFIST